MAISEGLGTALAGLASGIASLGSGVVSGAWNASANKRAYHFQRDLMELQAQLNYDYSKQYNEWAARWNMENAPTLTRKGLESAGYNPILAINGGAGLGSGISNATSMTSGGSAQQANPINTGNLAETLGSLANAYNVFKTQKKIGDATVAKLKAETENIEEDTKLKAYQKPLTLLGEFLEGNDLGVSNAKLPPLPTILNGVDNVTGNAKQYVDGVKERIYNVQSAVNNFRSIPSRLVWKYIDTIGDNYHYLNLNTRNYGLRFDKWLPRSSTTGINRYSRILNNQYHIKDLLPKKRSY